MIKGWRYNPNWCAYFVARRQEAEQKRWNDELIKSQRDMVAITQQRADEARKHEQECHARKVEAGEIPGPTVN